MERSPGTKVRRAGGARRTGVALIVAAVVLTGLAFTPGKAEAAGVTTHAWMALEGIDRVTTPQLKALLTANKEYVRSGAHFPDSGYAVTNLYGEEAHWQRFVDALAARIRARPDCPDLTAIHGPCAPLIAFMMGISAHGMGDEVWDWLFEPNGPDLDEYYTPPDLGDYASEGGAELQMDLVAIADHRQPTDKIVSFPDHADLLAAFNAVQFTQVDEGAINLGKIAMDVVHQAEAGWAPTHIDAVHEAMPWMSHNMKTAPGGVDWAAVAIAGYYETMWGQLLGNQPPTKVSITYPANGQDRIPATGWVRDHAPGSARGRGGARTRIAAALTYARPYDPSSATGGTVAQELPAGAMTLTVRDTAEPVAIQAGYPKSVPYGVGSGEHLVDIQPANDLAPCTWYRVSVTEDLIDAKGLPVTPSTWDFRTGTDADGHKCVDDPYTSDELFVGSVIGHVFDRQETPAELDAANYALARGTTRRDFVTGQLASPEVRTAIVTDAYQRYLHRAPDEGGLAYWTQQLTTLSVPAFQARILGSDEVYAAAGGTNRAYVDALYPLVFGRTVDPGGGAYWAARLDAGLPRPSLAKRLLTSDEAARTIVTDAYQRFLGRAPDQGGLGYWTGVVVRGADPRDLWRSLMISAEFAANAQAG